jgi:dihydrofolate reductase
MRKIISCMHISLDGFVAGLNGEMNWPLAGSKPNASKHDIDHSKWYNKAHKIVLSKTMKNKDLPNTTIISYNLSDRINEIKQQAGSEILIFGSPTATHALIQQNLIDGYWLFVNPIILGEGIPLFTGIKDKTNLKLLTTRQFTCGVTELNYVVDK